MKHRKKYCLNAYNVRKYNLKRKLFAFFIIMNIILILYTKFISEPIIYRSVSASLSSTATNSINMAVADAMNQNASFSNLILVTKNQNNEIQSIKADTVKVNVLSRLVTKLVLTNLLENIKFPVKVALGEFSGIALLSGKGPEILVKIKPYGEVFCDFSSSFDSAGVNQTYHKLYLNVLVKMNVIFPFKKLVVDSSSKILVDETMIIGKIPDVYLNSNNLTDMLNMVPQKFTS